MVALAAVLWDSRIAAQTDDPLLRNDWLPAERARIQGTVARMARELESAVGSYGVTDENGRRFAIDTRGQLSFDPLYAGGDALQPHQSNWKPVVARTDDAPLYYPEAVALYERGLRNEAFYLMKGLRAMAFLNVAEDSGVVSDRPLADSAAVRRAAEQATAWLNEAQRRLSAREFERLDRLSDPFAIYDPQRARTLVFSNRYAWRVAFPGEWRFQRGLDRASQTRSRGGDRATVYLQRGAWQAMLATDVPPDGQPLPGLPALIREWDLRRTLTGQRKRVLQYRRESIALSSAADGGAEVSAGANSAAYRASLTDRRFRYEFYEAYALGRSPQARAVFLQLSRKKPLRGDPSANGNAEEFVFGDAEFRTLVAALLARLR